MMNPDKKLKALLILFAIACFLAGFFSGVGALKFALEHENSVKSVHGSRTANQQESVYSPHE